MTFVGSRRLCLHRPLPPDKSKAKQNKTTTLKFIFYDCDGIKVKIIQAGFIIKAFFNFLRNYN